MPRGIPNSKFDVNSVILQTNEDTGMSIINLFPGVIHFHKTGDCSLLSKSLKIAFDYQLLVQVSDYMMPEGFYDVNQTLLFIDEMGFEKHLIRYDFKCLAPWNIGELYFLSSWEPGMNVSPWQYWSDFGKHITEDNVEGINFKRLVKYDISKAPVDKELSFDDMYDVPEAKNWQQKRESQGLYSTEAGRKFKYEEKPGYFVDDVEVDWRPYVVKSEKADEQEQTKHVGRRRRCKSCGNLFYRDELQNGLCKKCRK